MKSFSVLIILIFSFAISVLPQDSENKDAVELYKKALEYYNKGEIEKAIGALEESIKLDSKFSDARNKLVEIYLNQESVIGRAKAEMELKNAIKEDPDNIEYQISLGNAYLKKRFIYDAKNTLNIWQKNIRIMQRFYLTLEMYMPSIMRGIKTHTLDMVTM